MKTLIAGMIFFATASVAQEVDPNALQVTLSVNCFKDLSPYIQELETTYQEKPLFAGRSILPVLDLATRKIDPMEGVMISFVNQDTGTFTNLLVFPDGSGCEVSYGGEFTPVTN